MKVAFFRGSKGLRLREFSEALPKPMVPVGQRQIIWHTRKYYAHHGHKEFILALGAVQTVILLSSNIDEWKVTFVDTGIESNIGERLRVRKHLASDDLFVCSHADCLTDA